MDTLWINNKGHTLILSIEPSSVQELSFFFVELQINLLQLDEKAVQTRPKKTKRTKKKSVSTSTSDKRFHKREVDPYFSHSGNAYTIVDYLMDKQSEPGPLSTSTPRDRVELETLHVEPDMDMYYYLQQRQRRPHHGSIDKVPLLF